MAIDTSLLLPPPHHLERGPSAWRVEARVRLDLHPAVDREIVASWLAPGLERATAARLSSGAGDALCEVPGTSSSAPSEGGGSGASAIHLDQVDDTLEPEAYRLTIDETGVRAIAGSPLGLLRAAATLAQWLVLHPAPGPEPPSIEGAVIDDQPALRHRAVSLDVSRNRVPRMSDLLDLVDRLARLKISQLQLYTEHTFAYAGHETVWRGWSPLRPDEIRALDDACRRRGIELVPNQNSFGHFHRWLVHDTYRPLAECPEGIEHPFSIEVEPFSLCAVDERVPALLDDLYGQLLACHRSGWLNVGCDETMDLGRCRSHDACEARGRHTVYLEFLRTLSNLAARHGRRILFWGDIVLEEPACVADLPEDAVALLWGYEADHPFDRDAARFAAAGREVWLCPGTASWSSLGGRFEVACRNIAAAADATRHGATGLVICDWGDHGHIQPPAISWPGFAAGAAAAWVGPNGTAPTLAQVERWVDAYFADDDAGVIGEVLRRLGSVQSLSGATSINGGPLFFALHLDEKPPSERRGDGMNRDGLSAVRDELAAIRQRLESARPARGDGDLVLGELRWVIAMLDWAARFAMLRLAAPPAEEEGSAQERSRLRADLEPLVRQFERLWLARSRPGGLDVSLERLRGYGRRLDAPLAPPPSEPASEPLPAPPPVEQRQAPSSSSR